PLYQLRVSLKCCSGRMNASANYDQRGKTSRIFLRQIPSAVSPHGQPREIGPGSVAVKFLGRGFQSGHSHIGHGRLNPPKIFSALRHYHDRWNAGAVHADGGANASISLLQTIVGTLSGAMEKENDWPFLPGCPIIRNEDLVFVDHTLKGYGSIKKARFMAFCEDGNSDPQTEEKK